MRDHKRIPHRLKTGILIRAYHYYEHYLKRKRKEEEKKVPNV